MNIKTKKVSLLITLGLALTFAGQSFAAEIPFKDISNVSAKDKILALQEKGYIKGVSEGIFVPDRAITAAEGIQLIVTTLKLNLDTVRFIKEPKATDYFPKANNDAWYANALIIISVKGIDFPSDLDPNQEWTREEFTYYLIKSIEKNEGLPMINLVPKEIADEDQITIIYSGAIQRALAYKVTQLDVDGKFTPKAKLSRAEAVEQIYNALEYTKEHSAPNIDTQGQANEKIGVRGTVKDIVNGKDGITFSVEGKKQADTLYDIATVTVNRDTILNNVTSYNDIKEGDIVEVTFPDIVVQSYPIMGAAVKLTVISSN